MEAIDRGGNTYEIVQKGYSKGTACDVILKKSEWNWIRHMYLETV